MPVERPCSDIQLLYHRQIPKNTIGFVIQKQFRKDRCFRVSSLVKHKPGRKPKLPKRVLDACKEHSVFWESAKAREQCRHCDDRTHPQLFVELSRLDKGF